MSTDLTEQSKGKVETICRDCVFAQYIDDSLDHTIYKSQIGCELGRIKKFKERGTTLEVIEETNSSYYKIGRYCTTCRNKEWGAKIPKGQWKQNVRNYLLSKFQCELIIDGTETDEIEKVVWTAEDAFRQKLKPAMVIMAIDTDLINQFKMLNEIRRMGEDKWRLETISVEECLKYVKSPYLSLFKAGSQVPVNYLRRIENALNVELMQFLAIRPISSDGSGLFIYRSQHSLEDLERLSVEQEKPYLVQNFDELPML